MGFREGIAAYYDVLGWRGVLAASACRLARFPKEITVQPAGIRHPIHLRLLTTDPFAYSSVLLQEEYGVDLPFSPKVIVDGGANVGMTSIYFANRYPEAQVIAVEAEASNFAALLRNVSKYPSIVPVHAALWKHDGEISVKEPDPSSGAYGQWGFVTKEGHGPKVRAITMQTLMREMNLPAIDIAKIDIEGAECEIFEDPRWLSGVRCVMIELHDRFRPGCNEVVEPAMRNFSRSQHHDTTIFVRPLAQI